MSTNVIRFLWATLRPGFWSALVPPGSSPCNSRQAWPTVDLMLVRDTWSCFDVMSDSIAYAAIIEILYAFWGKQSVYCAAKSELQYTMTYVVDIVESQPISSGIIKDWWSFVNWYRVASSTNESKRAFMQRERESRTGERANRTRAWEYVHREITSLYYVSLLCAYSDRCCYWVSQNTIDTLGESIYCGWLSSYTVDALDDHKNRNKLSILCGKNSI